MATENIQENARKIVSEKLEQPPVNNFYSDDFIVEFLPTSMERINWEKYIQSQLQDKFCSWHDFFFKVKAPEPAVFSIRKDKPFEIGRIRGRNNNLVSDVTRGYAEAWLYAEQNKVCREIKDFPFPEAQAKQYHLRPLSLCHRLLTLHFSKYQSITPRDVFSNTARTVFIYELLYPEQGIVGIRKAGQQWKVVLTETPDGQDLKEKSCQAVDQWLTDNTPSIKQMQLTFG